MSQTFTLVGSSSELSVDHFPPIELKPNVLYKIGLIGFYSYNTIPNIEKGRNKFYWDNTNFTFETGIYEIQDIERVLKNKLGADNITLKLNKVTQKCEINSQFHIDFAPKDSIASFPLHCIRIFGKFIHAWLD